MRSQSALRLDAAAAIERGKGRLIFDHPRHPDRLVKVMKPGVRAREAAKRARFSMAGQFGANKVFAKEVLYFLSIQGRQPDLLPLFPWIHGFIETDLGLGVVQEKITDDRGALAPSLKQLTEAGALTERHRELARALCDRLAAGQVVFHDISPGNIVAAGGRENPSRLVIVDGFGDPGVPPLRRLWPAYNRLRQRRRLRALRECLGLDGGAPAASCARGTPAV
jgi:hypothetical protein